MDEKPLVDIIAERLDRDEIELPVFQPVALELQRLVTRGDYGIAEMARIIQKDQALATRVLRMANSSFYAGMKPITTLKEATIRLGARSLINLVTVATQEQLYGSHRNGFDSWRKPLWSHALGVAGAARWLSLHLGLRQLAEESFLAGLLHDIGKLLLLKIIEDLEKSGKGLRDISRSLIKEILETMHTKHGELLLKKQNIPEVYCAIARIHHDPEVEGKNIVLNLVRLGNLVCHKLGIGLKHEQELMLSTTPEATNLMVKDMLLAELQVKLEEHMASLQKLSRVN